MEWHPSGTKKLGLLKHFLKSVGAKCAHTGQRARTLNKLLRKAGHSGRLEERRLDSKRGRKPWVATKETFRAVYTLL